MLRPSRALLATALLLAPAAVDAQLVRGRVIDSATGEGVADAAVTLLTATDLVQERVVTDSIGGFVVRAPSAGQYSLSLLRIGYASLTTVPFEIGRGEIVDVEVRLSIGAIPLDPLIITARARRERAALQQFRARAEGEGVGAFGEFLTREDVDRHTGGNTTDLFRGLRNVTLAPAFTFELGFAPGRNLIVLQSGAERRCMPALYVDGIRFRQTPSSTVDDYLDPGVLEGVEVYRGTAAPVEYPGGDCGVVLFWTREAEPGKDWNWKRIALGVGGIATVILLAR